MSDYNGWSNYATWNINLWVDNDERDYRLKVDYLNKLKLPVTATDVQRFVKDYMGNTTPDLKEATGEGYRIQDVNWQEIADFWEDERQIQAGN